MKFKEDRPIFIQIAEWLEEAILSGTFPEESQIPSITDFSVNYRINPATALKGINLLVEQGTIYKKRGIGMFVSSGAKQSLLKKRRERFYHDYVERLLEEAGRLELNKEDIWRMIERGYKK